MELLLLTLKVEYKLYVQDNSFLGFFFNSSVSGVIFTPEKEFLNYGLTNVIRVPARVVLESSSLNDVILTNKPCFVLTTGVLY